MSTLLLARIVSLPCPRPSTVLLGRVIEEATVPPFFRGKNGNAAAPVVMAAEGAWLCIPIWTTPRGREEELLQARRAVFYIDGTAKFVSTIQTRPTTPRSSPVLAPPGSRVYQGCVHQNSQITAPQCRYALGATRAMVSAAEQHSGLTCDGLSEDEIQLLGHWAPGHRPTPPAGPGDTPGLAFSMAVQSAVEKLALQL